MNREIITLCALGLINIVTFVLYAIDKWLAIEDKRRISEKTLLLWSAFGGAVGAILAMNIVHHKSRKTKFRVLVPLFLVLQIALAGLYWFYFLR